MATSQTDTCNHVTITDHWVDAAAFIELWNWCTAGEDRSLRCMVPRWTVKIEYALNEFDLLMAQRVDNSNHRGLSHFHLDIGCLDGAVGHPKRFKYTTVLAWRWLVFEKTMVRLNFHCLQYHQPGVEFGWANQMVTLFTRVDCRETSIVVALCGCTVKDIKTLVSLYLHVLRESEHKDLNHISLTVCHDICNVHPDIIRQCQDEAAFMLCGRHPNLPTNLVSIVFDERSQCAD